MSLIIYDSIIIYLEFKNANLRFSSFEIFTIIYIYILVTIYTKYTDKIRNILYTLSFFSFYIEFFFHFDILFLEEI